MTLVFADPNPAFPLELEREIFETAALMHPREIPNLLRVARRVLIWIEPLRYKVIRVTAENEDIILHAINLKPADFFHKAVRHLCLQWDVQENRARQVLEVCSGVVNLSFSQSSSTLLPILAVMPLQCLSTQVQRLFGGAIDPKHPLFASITHLRPLDGSRDFDRFYEQIPQLPALTHLALDAEEVSKDMAQTLLRECPRLELLLLLWFSDDEYESAQIPHVYDVRFVIALCPNDYWGHWEAGAEGLPHFWFLGDDFVARKRNKAIEATCYWL
ncbi:hypothetical protein B0H13DRAFT_2670920 [Mycena leptocephala]|nr:hypothetical protein B0H13DRAFT_2672342 [Mycena leptocephala]KAJ7865389.1 hypothetical protein B0H13DRAFT_2670920 [Mycena leptocephala]